MKNIDDIESLMSELVKDQPDLAKVRPLARRLGLAFKGDLVELMADVLRAAGKKATSKPAGKKWEIEA